MEKLFLERRKEITSGKLAKIPDMKEEYPLLFEEEYVRMIIFFVNLILIIVSLSINFFTSKRLNLSHIFAIK